MSIYINNAILNTQPSDLAENDLQVQTDQFAIDGTMRRNKIGQKKQATMQFPSMSPFDYTSLKNKFITGSGVYYYNDQSSNGIYAFSGMPNFQESSYLPGASLFRPFQVTIREI